MFLNDINLFFNIKYCLSGGINFVDKKNRSLINKIISKRRTIHQFKPDQLPEKAVILNAIESARWAPNHYLSQPWHFYLLGPYTIEAIVKLNAELVKDKNGEKAAKIKFDRWSKVPGWLVLTCVSSDDQIRAQEDYAACCCAAQNMMLSLWQEGVGVKWNTGDVIKDQRFYDLIQVNPELETVVGLFWYGYAEVVPNICRDPIEQILTELP